MVTTLGLEMVSRWFRPSLGDLVPGVRQESHRSARCWPRDSRLLKTALVCCAAGLASQAKAWDFSPWRIVQVEIESSVSSGYSPGYATCEYRTDTTLHSWESEAGLQGTFSGSAKVSYECCSKGGYSYGYSYYCDTYHVDVFGDISIGSESFSVDPGSCMEYESCFSEVRFTISFSRPMRMVWGSCQSGTDSGYQEPCPFDDSYQSSGSMEFPGAGVDPKDPYQYYSFLNYAFVFQGASGTWSFAYDVRFERMYPADILPDGLVDGSDISAILSKWGGPYDPQRTAADVNLDGKVDAEDLAAVLFAWGTPG